MSSRRQASSKAAKALAATAKLRELREGGKRSRIDEVEEEADAIENVYDELDENEYRELVAKRRAQGGDFDVNDHGEGYEDMGEEEDWTTRNENYSSDEEYDDRGKKLPKAAPEPKKKMSAQEKAKRANEKAKSKASLMVGGAPKKKKLDDVAAEADTDALLEDILAGVDMDIGAQAPAPASSKSSAAFCASNWSALSNSVTLSVWQRPFMFNALFSESGHAAAMNIKIRPHNVACLVLDNLLSRELHNRNKMNFPALKMAGFSVNAPL